MARPAKPAARLQAVPQPLTSLISKSEKARRKLAPGTWQHRMLGDNLRALRLAAALMNSRADDLGRFTPADLQAARRVLAAMTGRTRKTLEKFPPGTAPHTLQRNRLQALRRATACIRAALAKHPAPAQRRSIAKGRGNTGGGPLPAG